jgi:hypothetical protein
MSESLLAYCRARRDAKGAGEMQIWSVQTVMLLAVSLAIIWINDAQYDKHNGHRTDFKPKGSHLGQANGRTLPAGAHSLV